MITLVLDDADGWKKLAAALGKMDSATASSEQSISNQDGQQHRQAAFMNVPAALTESIDGKTSTPAAVPELAAEVVTKSVTNRSPAHCGQMGLATAGSEEIIGNEAGLGQRDQAAFI